MNKFIAFLFVFLALSALLSISIHPVRASGDLWIERAPMPNAEYNFGAVSVNGEIYAIGFNFTYVFDSSADTWVSKTPIPSHRQGVAIATCQNKIYVIGGWNSTDPNTGIAITLGTNEMYEPATDTWTTKASMPLPTAFMGANEVDGKIYVISGMADIAKPTLSSSNWVYDPLRNSWSTVASIPTPIFSYASAVVGSKIYIVGGDGGKSLAVSNLNQIYDTETNIWTFGQPLPLAIRLEGAGVTTGLLASARLYIVGGTNNGFDGVKTTQIYNPQTDQWTLGAQMSTARLGLAVATVNDSLYALGGESFTGNIQIRGEIHTINEQYIPLDYQGPIPSPYIPTPSPYSTSTPIPTPTPSPPNFGPTSSPTPSPSIPEFSSLAIPLFLTVIVAAGLLVYHKKHKRRKTNKLEIK
jgi:N-acetylneuraminic acid mutarotase